MAVEADLEAVAVIALARVPHDVGRALLQGHGEPEQDTLVDAMPTPEQL
jgi:hypothetical protein